MIRAGWWLPLLFAAQALAQDDPMVGRYKQFFREEIAGKWEREGLAEMRVVMVRGFQRHDVPEAARWLMLKAMSDEAGDVVRAAVQILSNYKGPGTVAAMADAWGKKFKKSPEGRALVLEAFGKIKLDTAEGPIAKGFKDRDARVAAAACLAAGAGPRIKFRADLEKLLKHKHPVVRAAACTALAQLGGEQSLPLIFKVFCGDASHRVRHDAWQACKKLTLLDLPCDPTAWQDFWKERAGEATGDSKNPWGATFPRLHAKARPAASFFKIPVLADRIVFVLDTSNDMNSPWLIDHKTERKKPKADRIPSFFSVKTRWGLVKAYVNACLKQLPEDTRVAFVFYNLNVAVFPETGKFLKNTKKSRGLIKKHLDEGVTLGGTTALFDGLARGWGFLKEGDADTNFKKGCDTLVFVTDGRPTAGRLKKLPDRIRDEVWRVAASRQIHVHAVGLHNHQFDLLQAMAKDSGALYVHAQQHGDPAEPQDLDFWPKKKKAFEQARKKTK